MRYRDILPIVTLRSAASSIAPRVWRQLDFVVLTYGIHRVEVALTRVVAERGCIKTPRTWFKCPACGALAAALAIVGDSYHPVGCRKCVRWRSRSYRVSGKAPHVGAVSARAPRGR